MGERNEIDITPQGVPDDDSSDLIPQKATYQERIRTVIEELQSAISEENPFKDELQSAADNLLNIIDEAIYEEGLLELFNSIESDLMDRTFLIFEEVIKVFSEVESLPVEVRDIFSKRFGYYKYYSNIPPEHLRKTGPNFLKKLKEYIYHTNPFVDLWGIATNMNWADMDHIPNPQGFSYDSWRAEHFMEAFLTLYSKYGATIVPDHTLSSDGEIVRLNGTSSENSMYNFGYFLVTFERFPSIVGIGTVDTNLDAFNYDFNNPELRKEFIHSSLNSSGENFYISSFKLIYMGKNIYEKLQ